MNQNLLRPVLTAYGRALLSQLTGKMLLLSVIPFLLSLLLWGALLWTGLQPMLDTMHALFADYGLFSTSGNVLSTFGLGFLKTVIVPLLALLMLLPLMVVTALLFMGVVAMPAIVRHVSQRQFPQLEKKHGGSFAGSLAVNLTGFLIFVPLWLFSLPLYALAPVAIIAQAVLWGWLTQRVMSYDALSEHASEEERATLIARHKRQLMLIGIFSGAAGALPGIVWIGGTIVAVFLFPFLAALSIWLYVVIFIFTGLWFQYYCLQALSDLRAERAAGGAVQAVS
ncbi:EI24 domain-containing protein [Massilia sp. GCM10020059]|uniref:EI24 domain-containing protein n=1 Tax=Massilia agrisoli TaxID=2892444 RepID=A0ABS8IPS9_9BURK|nr:EI24 domain-containing protein [Massilia agrisoli]MCC6069858.1 EI24 domain-containing protein [Massilia agrisoli]